MKPFRDLQNMFSSLECFSLPLPVTTFQLYTVSQKNVTLFTFAKTWLNIIQFK